MIAVGALPEAPTTAAAYAHAYAACGWRSFPVRLLEKRPSYHGWQRDATLDPAQINRYWPSDPARNVGLVTGELFDVFDVEAKHLDRFLGWMRDGGYWLPETPVAITARGGRHVFTRPVGVDGTRRLYCGGVHIGELKSRGGLVVAPPSVVEIDGQRGSYSWMWAPAGLRLATAPSWLLTLLEPARPVRFVARIGSVTEGEKRLDALVKSVREREPGSRNDYLFWATRRALEEGMPDGIVASYMELVGVEVGLPRAEVERTIASAMSAAATPESDNAAH